MSRGLLLEILDLLERADMVVAEEMDLDESLEPLHHDLVGMIGRLDELHARAFAEDEN